MGNFNELVKRMEQGLEELRQLDYELQMHLENIQKLMEKYETLLDD